MLKSLLLSALLLLASSPLPAQTAAEYFDRANEAFRNKDYKANVELLEKSIQAGADHPTILYFLARGYALTGNTRKTIETLNGLADLGITYKPEEDENFRSIHSATDFEKVVSRFQENLKPLNIAQPAITLPDNFIPEGIAYDPAEKSFFFGNINQGVILRYKEGKFQEFSRASDGLWSVLGMSIHQPSRTLWVASSAFAGSEKGRAGIFHYDLKDGKLLNKYILSEGNHVLGEVIVSSDGTIFATDSVDPAIYTIKEGKLTVILGPEPFRSPQGACLSADERILFVADYSRGIFAIDLKTRRHWKLSRDSGVTTVAGIDGLYCHKTGLIAIQNGVQPNRVLRLHVNEEATTIRRSEVLESNHDLFPEPTLGTLVDHEFYFIGNSMISPWLENPDVKLKPAVILKLSL